MMTSNNYNVDLAKLTDKKLLFDFAKEMYFDEKTLGTESDRDKSLIRLPKLTAFMEGFFKEEITSKSKVQITKETKTRWLFSNRNEL